MTLSGALHGSHAARHASGGSELQVVDSSAQVKLSYARGLLFCAAIMALAWPICAMLP
jgi:hypothetical protein